MLEEAYKFMNSNWLKQWSKFDDCHGLAEPKRWEWLLAYWTGDLFNLIFLFLLHSMYE